MFWVGRSAGVPPPVAAEAPPASDNKPAAPRTGTALAPRFRFGLCFAFDILKSSHSILRIGIDCVEIASLNRTLGSGAKQARIRAWRWIDARLLAPVCCACCYGPIAACRVIHASVHGPEWSHRD